MALVRPPLDRGPGVYLQEVPSGVHTIIGVPTSVAVFIGRTASGRIDGPVQVSSFDDFKTKFGGYLADSPMAYTVEDFFLNGGSTAFIVRLFQPDEAPDPQAAPKPWLGTQAIPTDTTATVTNPSVELKQLFAASPGVWGKELTCFTSLPKSPDGTVGYSQAVRDRFTTSTWKPSTDGDDVLFDVTITRISAQTGKQVAQEIYKGVSTNEAAGERYLRRILELQSSLAQFQPKWDASSVGSDSAPITSEDLYKDALTLLNKHVEVYNLLCIPPDTHEADLLAAVQRNALPMCKEKRATLIVDSPSSWNENNVKDKTAENFNEDLGIDVGDETSRFAALYYPRVLRADPLLGGGTRIFPTCGLIAGVIARTDAARGVWKAPAGTSAGVSGIVKLADKVDDATSNYLNAIGVNCLRSFTATGPVVWGARTIRGSDVLADDFKYLPVRRLTDYIETSLQRSTLWAVFEPNDEPLWSQLRSDIGSFMTDLFRQGAFQGSSRDKAFFVKCDATTTTQDDIDRGIVNIQVGFAPLKPAEFVVIYLQQITNQGAA